MIIIINTVQLLLMRAREYQKQWQTLNEENTRKEKKKFPFTIFDFILFTRNMLENL